MSDHPADQQGDDFQRFDLQLDESAVRELSDWAGISDQAATTAVALLYAATWDSLAVVHVVRDSFQISCSAPAFNTSLNPSLPLSSFLSEVGQISNFHDLMEPVGPLVPSHAELSIYTHASNPTKIEVITRPTISSDRSIARMTNDMQALLRKMVGCPGARLCDLSLASATQTAASRTTRPGMTRKPNDSRILHELYLSAAARASDAPALICSESTISYGDLAGISEGIATRLMERGLGRGSVAAIVMERGWEQIAAMLGVLRAGGAYLPISADLPLERQAQLIRQSGTPLGITQHRLVEAVDWPPGFEPMGIGRNDPIPRIGSNSLPQARNDDLAYVMFTSGSTGVPKGVAVEHRSVSNTLLDLIRRFELSPTDRILSLTSFSFDPSVFDVFATLATGGAIVLPDPDDRLNPESWLRLIDDHEVSIWQSVPSHARILLDHVELTANGAHSSSTRSMNSIRLAMMGGEEIPVSLVRRFQSASHGCKFFGMYGVTEASICSSFIDASESELLHQTLSCGRSLDNQSLLVLDPLLRPCPPGIVGEMYIGGDGLARGYWQQAGMTRDRFVVHPSSGERLYRTGDLGRIDRTGSVWFLGRSDTQVKINGHRVELAEIEHVLSEHPRVSDCAVLLAQRSGSDHLTAYLSISSDLQAPSKEFRSFLADRLPAYMIPSTFVVLSELPKNPNGKIDRTQLLEDVSASNTHTRAALQGFTDAQRAVHNVWSDILGLDEIGLDENFFELGGESIDAVTAVAQLSGGASPLVAKDIYDAPTIRELSKIYARASQAKASIPTYEVTQPIGGPTPLSSAQETLSLLERLEPGNPFLVGSTLYEVAGLLDNQVVGRAMQVLADRHDTFRTVFHLVEGQLTQRYLPAGSIGFDQIDIPSPDQGQGQVLHDLFQSIASLPMALERGPLCRFTLLRFPEGVHKFVLSMHQLVSDGVTLALFVREFEEIYNSMMLGRSPELTISPQYSEYVAWDRARRDEAHSAGVRDYWQKQYERNPVLVLPADHKKKSLITFAGHSLPFDITGASVSQIELLARTCQATPFCVLLAMLDILLLPFAPSGDVPVSTVLQGREEPQFASTFGEFSRGSFLVARVDDHPTLRRLVHRLMASIAGAMSNGPLAMEDWLLLGAGVGMDRHEVMFQLDQAAPVLQFAANEGHCSTASPWYWEHEELLNSAPVDLCVYLHETGAGGMRGQWIFDPTVLDRSTASELLQAYRQLLQLTVADLDTDVWELNRSAGRPPFRNRLFGRAEMSS